MTNLSDIAEDGWVKNWLPKPVRPYALLMRLDRPIGTWLLLLPCWWSLGLGWQLNQQKITLLELGYLYFLFTVGAILMRGAGCTINDLWDRKLDQLVARTANRPIASGVISVTNAILFLLLLLTLSLTILLQLNETCWLLGFLVLLLVFSYPTFKRFTYWPQFVLGLTFNWGALMGWVSITGTIDTPSLILYLAGIFWTLGYDTIYAHQDKEDDALIGVKSSALALENLTKPFIYIVYTVTIFGIFLIGWISKFSIPFYLVCLIALCQLIWQIRALDLDSPNDCLKKFKSNRLFGFLITFAIFLG
jgi:4-hydroxybenzoate polyprenyltransferase|tara:strand:+ start:106 stop:1020 length:915 start_codon:yes stop_codon:yes gene_type:complete